MQRAIYLRALVLGAATVLICHSTVAQTAKAANQARAQAANRKDNDVQQNALQTLLYLRNSISIIDSVRDRVRVLLEVGDALWLIDKEEARAVFKQSYERAAEFDQANSGDKNRPIPSTELQQTVITRVAQRDPALARSLMVNTSEQRKQTSDPFSNLYGVHGSQDEMLVKAAADTLSSDTSQAVATAKLAAADGISQQMRLFLLSLRAKDQVAADTLFSLTLQSALARHPKQLGEALFFWDYTFQRQAIYLGPVAWFREAPAEYPVPRELKQRALSFAVDAIIENAQQSYLASAAESDKPLILEQYTLLHSLTSQILPDVQALMPAAAPNLLAQLTRFDHELSEQGRKPPGPPDPLPQAPDVQGAVDKLLERAAKAPTAVARDGLYAKAALRLYLHGEYEHAMEIVGRIEDATLRLNVSEPIRFDWAGSLIERKKLDAALGLSRDIRNAEVRVAMLTRLAAAYFGDKQPDEAMMVLNEAEAAAGRASASSYLASAMLGMGQVYLRINDRNQAEESTSRAIQLINTGDEGGDWSLLGSAGGQSGKLAVRDVQWTLRKDGGLESVTAVYPRIAGLLDVLSKISEADLDEGLMLARQVKPKGLNYATQAALCRQTIERIQRKKVAPASKAGL